MANVESKLVISEPDFFAIKSSLKNFLKSQSTFADYDFEGSTLSQLIDLLSYNTHYLSFYMNMIANESFLDSASLRDSVVSHAKMLGYTPSSIRSAKARIDLSFTLASNPGVASITSLTLPKFTKFASSAIDGVNYIFTNLDEVTVTKSNNAFTFSDLDIFEGNPVTQVFTYNEQLNPLQEFKLLDKDIDTSTIEVIVQNSTVDLTQEAFTLATDSTTLESDSKVYFLDEITNGNYKIYFGSDILGKKLTDGNIVVISYVISKGRTANKATSFRLLDSVGGLTEGTIVVDQVAAGGAAAESIETIKALAPKTYASNGRAVTKNDYIALIQQRYPSFEAVNVWGGEENNPPVYGKVFISAKPSSGYEISRTEKDYIINTVINPISILTVTPEFVDPDFNYLNLNVRVTYDPTATTLTPGELSSLVRTRINNYANTYLDQFNSYFKISRLMHEIDMAHPSIVSNDVDVKIEKRLTPILGSSRNYIVKFFTELKRSTGTDRISSAPAYTAYDNEGVLREFYFEEVPLSSTGVSAVQVIRGGSDLITTPRLDVIGDGIGASLRAVVTNGKITSVIVDKSGSDYSTASIKAYDQDDNLLTNVVLKPLIENTTGKLRSYYFDNNNIKIVFSENAGTIDYLSGTITLSQFNPLDVKDSFKILKFYATPKNTLFNSERNTIITLDIDNQSQVTIDMVKVT
jgi:hypothetical protein